MTIVKKYVEPHYKTNQQKVKKVMIFHEKKHFHHF